MFVIINLLIKQLTFNHEGVLHGFVYSSYTLERTD